MGLFDWLTDNTGGVTAPWVATKEGLDQSVGNGSGMPPPMPPGSDPMTAGGDTPNGPGLPGQDIPPPLPPGQPPLTFQRPEFAQGRPMPPDPSTSDIGGGMQGAGPAPPDVPLPVPRPEGADLPPPTPMPAARPVGAPPPLPPTATGPSALPPNAAPTGGGPGMPPGSSPPPLSPGQAGDAYSAYRNAGGGAPVPIYGSNGGVPGGTSFLGRALGLDANKERSVLGGLGAGLTAAGNSQGKSKMQAFASGMGANLQGSEKSDDKAFDQRAKALQLANTAQATGDKAAYNRAMIDYYKEDLKLSTDKFTGKNTSDSQKYVQAQQRAAADPESRGALAMLNSGSITKEQFDAKIKEIKSGHLKSLGLDPNKAPPGTPPTTNDPGNPHRLMPGASQSDFDRDVQPGQAYINPKDGQVYIRKGAGPTPAAEAAPAAEQPTPEVAATGTDPEDTSSGV